MKKNILPVISDELCARMWHRQLVVASSVASVGGVLMMTLLLLILSPGIRGNVSLPPIAAEAFDQGLGRALWFIAGSDWRIIEQLVERFSYKRRFSLWRGIGLMAGFWGAEDEQQLKKLFKAASTFRPFFQQGAAQAVCMRYDMDDVADHNDSAAKLICGGSTAEVADLARSRMEKFAGEVMDSKVYFSWQNELVDFFSDAGTGKKETGATRYNTRRFLLDTP